MRVFVRLEHLLDDKSVCVICQSDDPENENCLAQWGEVLEVAGGRLIESDPKR